MLRGLEVERALRESRDARQNLVGGLRPPERLGILLMRVNELLDGGLEPRHTLVRAAAQLFVRQLGEPPLHETQPRPIRGCEVDVKPWTLGKPVPNERRLVGTVVVHDDVHVEVTGDLRLDQIEELTELDRAMPLMKLGNDLTRLRVERGEQRG